jgi:competence protein ComGC
MSLKVLLVVAVLFFILVPILSGEEQSLDSDDDNETHTEDD